MRRLALLALLACVVAGCVVVPQNRRKHLADPMMRFKTDASLPWALAQHARITGRVVQLPAQDAREVEQLLAALREAGVAVEDVEMRKADLEDVFIDLMAGEQTPLEVAR